ncbi:MAG: sigma 54-interacting transcriptional regulator [Bacteroidales bacterium]
MTTYNERLLTASEAQNRFSQNQWLTSIASPLILRAFQLVSTKNFALLLTDTEGCVLLLHSKAPFENTLKDLSVFPGGFPKLSSNIGACLSKIVREEGNLNYVEEVNKGKAANVLNCWATPLSSKSHGFVGILAAIANTDFDTTYALPILMQNADLIEGELIRAEQNKKMQSIKDFQISFFTKHLQPSIITDGSGRILLVNDAACSLLGVEREQLESKSITRYINEWPDLPQLSTKRQEVINQEVTLQNVKNNGTFLLSLKVIKYLSGKVDEICCTLTSVNTVISQANRYFGNEASKTFNHIIAVSPRIKQLVKEARAAASNTDPLLILGEPNTGKHTFAQAVHNDCPYCNSSFVRVDLAKLSPEMIDQVLWGYTKDYKPYLNLSPKLGVFELANGGTLYINEICLLSDVNQQKLLNLLKSSQVYRLGADQPIDVNVRLVFANTINLEAKVANKEFSKELFYALSKNSLRMPPLKERRADIPQLLNHFKNIISKEVGMPAPEIPKKFVLILKRYEWPNNFQEMKDLLEIIIRSKGKMFQNFKNERRFKKQHLYLDKQRALERIIPLDDHERMLIEDAYNVMEGSISSMSRRLKVSRNTLYLKLKRYGIGI